MDAGMDTPRERHVGAQVTDCMQQPSRADDLTQSHKNDPYVDSCGPSHSLTLRMGRYQGPTSSTFARILEINSSNLCHTMLWTTLVPAIKWYHKIHVKYERLVAEMSSPWLPYLIQLVAMTPSHASTSTIISGGLHCEMGMFEANKRGDKQVLRKP